VDRTNSHKGIYLRCLGLRKAEILSNRNENALEIHAAESGADDLQFSTTNSDGVRGRIGSLRRHICWDVYSVLKSCVEESNFGVGCRISKVEETVVEEIQRKVLLESDGQQKYQVFTKPWYYSTGTSFFGLHHP
jgi:hypothetical protein